jgi:hypothetical protein
MSSKKMVKNKGLLTKIKTQTHLQNCRQSYYEKIDLQFEMECPRCYDTMALCSNFDGLYYFCEQCGFLLYTLKYL